jgi:hypothetical protein
LALAGWIAMMFFDAIGSPDFAGGRFPDDLLHKPGQTRAI